MSAAALNKLQDSEVLALAAWCEATGRSWKQELFTAWESAGERTSYPYTSELQAIRNRHGAEVVRLVTTGELLDAAKQVKDAKSKALSERIFAGVYPCGIVYADKKRERAGDYARLAFLPFASLVLDFEKDCPQNLRAEIVADAARIQARKGEHYQISSCGQTVVLGEVAS